VTRTLLVNISPAPGMKATAAARGSGSGILGTGSGAPGAGSTRSGGGGFPASPVLRLADSRSCEVAGTGARCCSHRRRLTGTWGPRECEWLLWPPAQMRAAASAQATGVGARGGASEAALGDTRVRVGPWECWRAREDARVGPSGGARGPTAACGGGRQGISELRRHHQQGAVSSMPKQPTV
jgi:hypothetical protein